MTQIRDIRNQLPRANWSIGSQPNKTSVTWHYNGPPVAAHRLSGNGVIGQLHIDCGWQMRPGWAGVPTGADGLQYHYAIGGDGVVYRTRDDDAVLWHCAHEVGNAQSISVHVPIGGDQRPTAEQIASLYWLTDLLIDRYGMDNRDSARGHHEWSRSACPGPHLKRLLRQYREEPRTEWLRPPQTYETLRSTDVYQSPDGGGVAMTLLRSMQVEIGALVPGRYRAWISNGTGFVDLTDLEHVEPIPDTPVRPVPYTIHSQIIAMPVVTRQQVVDRIVQRNNGEYTRRDIERYIVPAYFQACQAADVDPLIAIAQMCHETDYLSSWWAARPRRNPAGIGVTGEPGKGLSFPTWARHAIPAHVGRLVAYAVDPDDYTPEQASLVQITLSYRALPSRFWGSAPTINGLTGTWATDPDYAAKLVRVARWLQEGA